MVQIPLEYIDKIEVMRGSQSAMYGNNAVGGVIKITTKRGSKETKASANFEVGSYGMYSVNGLLTGSQGDWSYSADIGRFEEDGYRENSYSWTNSYNLSATNEISDSLSAFVTANFAESEFGQPGGLNWDQFYNDPRQSTDLNNYHAWQTGTYTAQLNSDTDFGEGEVALSGSFRNMDFDMSDWSSLTKNDQWNLYFTPKYKFKVSEEANVIFGFDAEYISVDAATSQTQYPWPTYIPTDTKSGADVYRYSLAPYIAGDLEVEDFIFTLAGRYEYTTTDAKGYDSYVSANNYDENLSNSGLAANFGITYRIDDNSSTYFRFDQIYRYAALDEIAIYSGYAMYTPFNKDLVPEQGQNYEIGYKYYDDNWSLNANLFLQNLRNEIALTYNTPTYQGLNTNLDPTMRYGFDYELGYDDKYWGAKLFGTIMQSEFDGGEFNGNRVPLVPNYTNTLSVYIKPLEWIRLATNVTYMDSTPLGGDNSNTQQGAPSYFLLGFTAEFAFTKYSTLYLGMENALDEHYVSSGYSGYLYPAMGRTLKAGIRLTF